MTKPTQEQIDAAWKQLQAKLINAYVDQLRKEEVIDPTKRKKSSRSMEPQSDFANDGPALFMEGPKVNTLTHGDTVVGKKKRTWVQPKDYAEKPNKRNLRLRKNGDPKSLKGTTK